MNVNSSSPSVFWIRNGDSIPLSRVPFYTPEDFRRICLEQVYSGGRLALLSSVPALYGRKGGKTLLALAADDENGKIGVLCADLEEKNSYLSLSSEIPQAQGFEREIFEEQGILPKNHPWLKPLRKQETPYPFFKVKGEGIHEVAVGPVHAGIIEPGHFRFQCSGETVHHLEIQLGYQHRGAEELFLRSSPERRLVISESFAGDTVIGHALAYCMEIEALSKSEPPLYAHILRGAALELERISNHIGDLGALCGDIGYLPGAAWFGRIRGEFLNWLMELSGNRFGRGLLKPGGVRFNLSAQQTENFLIRLDKAERDLKETAELTFNHPAVCSRFEETGIVSRAAAEALGMVGPAARSSGCERDVRRDHPFGIFRFYHIPTAAADTGDVMARAVLRWLETERSIQFIREQLTGLLEQSLEVELQTEIQKMSPEHLAVSMVESWRGEILHLAVTTSKGEITGYKIVDPSFHNWFGLALALRGGQISDFPLCNKSFNLSYSGHDL
jgi:Ni,Fe-hydrogenase III large subunit